MSMHMRLSPWGLVLAGLLLCVIVSPEGYGEKLPADPSLVLHYTFDEDTGDTANDQSAYGNEGKIVKAQYLEEFDGRRGVLRFDGESAYLDCGDTDSLHVGGDMSFEMWARLNGPVKTNSAYVFGEHPLRSFRFGFYNWYSLDFLYYDYTHSPPAEVMLLPVTRKILSDTWSHIAVVIEYPRGRFYHNGELVQDMYMPMPGIQKIGNTHKYIGGTPAGYCPMDLDEFRFYRRALTAAEVAAHARGEEVPPGRDEELAVEVDWYEETAALRLSCKGTDYTGHTAEMTLLKGDYTAVVVPQKAALAEAFEGSGRFVATVKFPLSGLEGKSLDGVARILGPDGNLVKTVYRHAFLKKPEWVHTKEGYSDEVLPPWTPVQAETKPDGTVEVRVWGRRYVFGPTPFPQQIETRGKEILASPITLGGRVDGKAIAWKEGRVNLKETSKTAVSFEQICESDPLLLRVEAKIEYDGYMIFDCEIQARRDLAVDELTLEIPLRTRHTTLCYGDKVLPRNPEIPMKQWYSGAVRGDDLAFRFSPNIWLGDEERGLIWQTESDEHWHYADPQKAIEILPRGETTTFRANLVNVPTRLAAGEKLHYRFALLATPVKPMLRDAWDLRIARSEPYGGDLDLPDFKTDGKPTLDYYAEVGVRHLFTITCDLWCYPMPVHPRFSRALRRLIDETHARGLRLYNYLLYIGFPVVAPEFDIHGYHMAKRPLHTYTESINPPGHVRPGPVSIKYGADSQTTLLICQQSKAFQDAFIHNLARRMDEYGDDGIYTDGPVGIRPCKNVAHGCGYRAKDGSIRPTYPAFAVREFIKRIYTVVKQRRPDGVVDHHASFGPDHAATVYGDVVWTGEQWWHLRKTGAPGGYVAGQLSLDHFRTEFMGYQFGTPFEVLSHRLGSPMKISATSLLHDVVQRPSTPLAGPSASSPATGTSHFEVMTKLWKLRDQFGAKEAEKLFYWNNQDYVRVSPEKCYALLLKHPKNGVWAFISNLRPDAQTVTAQFNLDKLGLHGRKLNVFNVLTNEPFAMSADGKLSVSLGSEEWVYVWLRPTDGD